jgi:hypothetical protein
MTLPAPSPWFVVLVLENDSAASISLANVLAQLNSQAVKSYDVVAVEAASAKAFQFACEQADIDIITFDVTNRIPFQIKRPWVCYLLIPLPLRLEE